MKHTKKNHNAKHKSSHKTMNNQHVSIQLSQLHSYEDKISTVKDLGLHTTRSSNMSYHNLDSVQKLSPNSNIFISPKLHHENIDDKFSYVTPEYNSNFGNTYESELYAGDETIKDITPIKWREKEHLDISCQMPHFKTLV